MSWRSPLDHFLHLHDNSKLNASSFFNDSAIAKWMRGWQDQ